MKEWPKFFLLMPVAVLTVGVPVEDAAAQDVTGPRVRDVIIHSRPQHGDTYARGNRIGVAVWFDEEIAVTGSPRLELTIGTKTRPMTFDVCRGCGGTVALAFEYIVQADDYDADGVGIAAGTLSLNGATVTDLARNDADLDLRSHTFLKDPSHKVDGRTDLAPSVTELRIDSTPGTNETYVRGETIDVFVLFDENVVVSGFPRFALTMGSDTRFADFNESWGRDGHFAAFEYEVRAEDRDPDGLSIAADALRLNGGRIRDSAGQRADLNLARYTITNHPDHKVNGGAASRPVVTQLYLNAVRGDDNTYRRGSEIGVYVGFNRRVVVAGSPRLALMIGTKTRTASYQALYRHTEMYFGYRVQADDYDLDGLSIGADALRLNGGSIRDPEGVAADLSLARLVVTNDPFHKVDGRVNASATPSTLDFTCHGYDEGATRAYNCIPEPSQQPHMRTFVPPVGSACDGGRIAEFPPGRIVFQIRCSDGSPGRSAAWSYSGQGPELFVKPLDSQRFWVRTAFPGSSVHLSVWCRAPREHLVVNELLGTSWGNDGTNGIYGMGGCREVEVDSGGRDVQWWFTQELAATALTPPRSWEQVTGAGSALPAQALQDLAAAVEQERLWRRPSRGRMHPQRGAGVRGALTSGDDGGERRDSRITSRPQDRTYVLDGAPFRGATTRTVPLTLDLTCHGYVEAGGTRAYNCIPEPSQQHHMRTFVPPVGSACDLGRIAEFPPGRIVFQIRCRDDSPGQTAAWSYSGQGSELFVKPVDTPRVWVRTAFSGSSVHFVVRCRAPQESLVVNELLGTSWGNDGTNGIYGMAGCSEVEVDTGREDLQWWFAQELAATALTPPRSWEHVTGAGSALPAEARRDLATAAELERPWPRPGR